MDYEIYFTQEADKQLSKLDINIQKRIVSKIKNISKSPYSYLKKLVDSPYFRLRIGDYRVIVDIINNKMIIRIIRIAKRSNIYKRF